MFSTIFVLLKCLFACHDVMNFPPRKTNNVLAHIIMKPHLGLERKIHDKNVIIDRAEADPYQTPNTHLLYKGHFKMGQDGKTRIIIITM